MTLNFKQHFNGHPNQFVEKIYLSRPDQEITMHEARFLKSHYYQGFTNVYELKPKRHTIRKGNRWREGMDIHFVINNRTKNRLQFLPVIPCTRVDEIEIVYRSHYTKLTMVAQVFINRKLIGEAVLRNGDYKSSSLTVDKLAENDGFENTAAFLKYFNDDFKGQLIHWTQGLDYWDLKADNL